MTHFAFIERIANRFQFSVNLCHRRRDMLTLNRLNTDRHHIKPGTVQMQIHINKPYRTLYMIHCRGGKR